MSDTSDSGRTGDETIERVRRAWLTEDWAAVVVGLALIALVLSGVISGDLIP